MYLAHIRADGREQRVTDHLAGTAKLCGAFAEAFGERERGELIGGAQGLTPLHLDRYAVHRLDHAAALEAEMLL